MCVWVYDMGDLRVTSRLRNGRVEVGPELQ
jgi:hypothetical protein